MKIWILSAFAAIIAGAASAHAGYRASNTVAIGYWAVGDLGAVRASASTIETIGCSVSGNTWYSNGEGSSSDSLVTTCWARDQSNNYRTCYSYAPVVAEAASGISGDSRVEFSWYGAGGGGCMYLRVYNASDYRPKSL